MVDATCYLKGFFNAVEAWQGNCDVDVWRLEDSMGEVSNLERGTPSRNHNDWQSGYPLVTNITDELVAHVEALLELFQSETSFMAPLRSTDSHKFCYCIGDASAEGFAIATQHPDLSLETQDGLWDEVFAEGGSNLREAQNFGNHILNETKAGNYYGCDVWACTNPRGGIYSVKYSPALDNSILKVNLKLIV